MGLAARVLGSGLAWMVLGGTPSQAQMIGSTNREQQIAARHLRPASDFEAALIDEAMCRSATIRALVASLETSDLTVSVMIRRVRDRYVAGGLQFLSATPTDRILRIVLTFPLDRFARIAMLGHELQHAVAVAEATEIRSRQAFEGYYRDRGVPSTAEGAFETENARQTELRIREELALRRWSTCGSLKP